MAGNITQNQIYGGMTNKRKWTFDAAGRVSSWLETLPDGGSWLFDQGADTTFDGDGRPAKKIDKHRSYDDEGDGFVTETKYRIYSSVTGVEITETNDTGAKAKTSVYLNGKAVAEQRIEGESELVKFNFGDPIVGTEDKTDSDGVITPNDVDLTQREPLGASIPTTEAEETGMPLYYKGGNWKNPETGCEIGDMPLSCRYFKEAYAGLGGGIWVFKKDSGRPIPDPDADTAWGDAGKWEYQYLGNIPPTPSTPPPPPTDDPCAGKKGFLDYDSKNPNTNETGREHITKRHINPGMWKEKSKYRSSLIPTSRIFNKVTLINQATFRGATGYPTNNDTVTYIYAVPEITVPGFPVSFSYQEAIGKVGIKPKSPYNKLWTNTNTLVIKNDCVTVVTSFPGLPGYIQKDNDDRITGTPVWSDIAPSIDVEIDPF